MMTIKKCPQYELRILLFSLLNTKIAYDGNIVPVYESLPIGQTLPYIVIGRAEADPDEDKDYDIDEYKINVDIYTAYGGTLESCSILNDVYEVLSEAMITNTLQFPSTSVFCRTLFYFNHVSTEVIGNDRIFPDLLEQSSLELFFRIKQRM